MTFWIVRDYPNRINSTNTGAAFRAGSNDMDEFLQFAIDEARTGMRDGGIPIGSVVVHGGTVKIGRAHV